MHPSPPAGPDDIPDDDDGVLMGNNITALLGNALTGRTLTDGFPWELPGEDELKRMFPSYVIEEILGQGGMGVVYKALDTVFGGIVAIKLLPPKSASDAQLMARFKREAQLMKPLEHPGIVKIHSFVQTGEGNAYFVMDFVDGHTIHELVQLKRISVKRTLELMIQICDALSYLHSRGIIHRDIKPSNILVDQQGNARLLDFGIAGRLDRKGDTLTIAGHNPGTPFYMAPELHRGDAPTVASDVYSLGVTFYEMLTGECPQVNAPPPSARSRADKRIDRIVFRALRTDPAGRYGNTAEIRKAVEGCFPRKREQRKALVIAGCILGVAALAFIAIGRGPAGKAGRGAGGEVAVPSAIAPVPSAEVGASGVPEARPGNKVGDIFELALPGGSSMTFCYCPAGEFMMGSPPTEATRTSDEQQVRVRISRGFWMARTECTQAQWKAVTGEDPSHFKGDDLPVDRISWNAANDFVSRLEITGGLEGSWKATLPTGAQWEYACRAGSTTAFHFGDVFNGEQGNCRGDEPYGTNRQGPRMIRSVPVAGYPANAWGIHDMHGNVREWTSDWSGNGGREGTDPTGPPSGTVHSFRGGSWGDAPWRCRAARSARVSSDDMPGYWNGLRVAIVSTEPAVGGR